MNIKTAIAVALLLFSSVAHACTGWVIGFRGLNDAFDDVAFRNYVSRLGYCTKIWSWHQHSEAVKHISVLRTPYQLYGYSQGAVTVGNVLKQIPSKKPDFVITVGAYRTTDVDFSKYGVSFQNYFDSSGRGQRSPGIFLSVAHYKIQGEVNRIYYPPLLPGEQLAILDDGQMTSYESLR
jgi:hypothetical protein